MTKKYFLLLVLILLHLNSKLYTNEHGKLFVSIGGHCSSAALLINTGMRTAAYPFDWIESHHIEKLTQLLDNDFDSFLDPNHLHIINDSVFAHLKYNFKFHHEGTGWLTGNYPILVREWRAKYQRRVNRFRNLKNHKGKVFFIRTYLAKSGGGLSMPLPRDFEYLSLESSYQLFDALTRYFPRLDFVLIIINRDPNASCEISYLTEKIILIKEHSVLQDPNETQLLKKYKTFFNSL